MIRSMLAEKLSQMPVSFGRGQSNIRNRTGRGDTVRPYNTYCTLPGSRVPARMLRLLRVPSMYLPRSHACCLCCLWSHELLVAVGLGPGAVSLFELGWSELCCGSPGHIVLLRSWDSTALLNYTDSVTVWWLAS